MIIKWKENKKNCIFYTWNISNFNYDNISVKENVLKFSSGRKKWKYTVYLNNKNEIHNLNGYAYSKFFEKDEFLYVFYFINGLYLSIEDFAKETSHILCKFCKNFCKQECFL